MLQTRAPSPKLSPLHDSAGSEQSSDDDGAGGRGDRRKQPVASRGMGEENFGLTDNASETREGPDAAHFVGFPRKSPAKSKEVVTYQLSAGGDVGSLLEGDGQVAFYPGSSKPSQSSSH
jgi:hypothetical protein